MNNDSFRCLLHASLTIQAATGGRSYMGHHWQGHGTLIARSLAPPGRLGKVYSEAHCKLMHAGCAIDLPDDIHSSKHT